jgi:hypothetical protein
VTAALRARGFERALVWAGVLSYFAGALAWMGALRGEKEQVFPAGSAFNTGSAGASVARRYLEARAGRAGGPARVAVLGHPLGEPGPEATAVVLRVRPERARSVLLTGAERAWIERGGRLVLALHGDYGPVRLTALAAGPAAAKVFPTWPGVVRLQPAASRVVTGGAPLDAHTVFAIGGRPALLRAALGRGELLLLALPELIENGGLETADHLPLLLALAGAGRPVYFDEHVHGMESRPGIMDLLTGWGFGPALVLLVLVGAVALWRERARLGPEEDDHRERRTEAVDLLDSLAHLYDRSLTQAQALRLYRRGLERAVSLQSGLKGTALERRVDGLAGPEPSLAGINAAYGRMRPPSRRRDRAR